MEEMDLEILRGEKPQEGKAESAEIELNLSGNTSLESKLEEILSKVKVMETSMAKLTTVFERGGLFDGKTGNE